MTRIQKQADMSQAIGEVKKDVVKEVRKSTAKRKPWLACGVLVLLGIVGIIFWLLWITASTGLMRIPGFTQLAFAYPQPERQVESGVSAGVFVEEWFATNLRQRLIAGGGELADKTFSIAIPESSLTASLRDVLAQQQEEELVVIENAQVLLTEPNLMELYLPIQSGEVETALLATTSLAVENGAVALTPERVQVGSYELPKFAIASFLQPILEREVERINNEFGGYMRIDEVRVEAGTLVLVGELIAEVVQPV